MVDVIVDVDVLVDVDVVDVVVVVAVVVVVVAVVVVVGGGGGLDVNCMSGSKLEEHNQHTNLHYPDTTQQTNQ